LLRFCLSPFDMRDFFFVCLAEIHQPEALVFMDKIDTIYNEDAYLAVAKYLGVDWQM